MLFELIYHSIPVNQMDENELQQILEQAMEYNKVNNITGCLLFYQGQFLQILEGEQKSVEHLFRKIALDDRHGSISLLHTKKIKRREFGAWSMAFQNIEKSSYLTHIGFESNDFSHLVLLKKNSTVVKKLFGLIAESFLMSVNPN